MIFLSDFLLRNSLIIMSNVVFVKKQEKLFYRQEKSGILYIFVPKHVWGLDPSEKGWWCRWLCIWTCALWVSIQIGSDSEFSSSYSSERSDIYTCTTAAQSMEGTASFFSHLDLNKEVSSVSFKFKSARCPTRNRRNVPIKVQMSLMVSNSHHSACLVFLKFQGVCFYSE